jgi:hypothetical protein
VDKRRKRGKKKEDRTIKVGLRKIFASEQKRKKVTTAPENSSREDACQ